MRVLITGAAGFLGSHLAARLLAQGDEVLALDNLVTGSEANLESLRDHPRFRFVRHDVTVPWKGSAERVFNLACCASPKHYQSDPEKTVRTCMEGSLNMLRLAHRTDARIFQASTSEVYGEPEVHPQKESYRGSVSPIGPRACYDEGKRCAEALFFDYHRVHGTDIKVARIFNTYGPQMQLDDGRVVSNFIVQALRGEPLSVYGEGDQTRSFCYQSDEVDGIYRLFMSDYSMPVNIGNPDEFTVMELARKVLALTGSGSRKCRTPASTSASRRTSG